MCACIQCMLGTRYYVMGASYILFYHLLSFLSAGPEFVVDSN